MKIIFKSFLFLFFSFVAVAVVPQKKISQQLVLDDAIQAKYPDASACLLNLNQVNDVTIASEVANQCLCRNSANNGWENQAILIDIATQVTDSQSTIANEDLIIFSDQSATNDATKYITFEDFKTSLGTVTTTGGTTGAPAFKVHDVTGSLSTLDNEDRFVVSDESVTDDPNRYITYQNLLLLFAFDLHDDVSTAKATLANDDRLLISDESDTGDPNKYVTFQNLRTSVLANLGNQFKVADVADTETTAADDDFFVFADESATGDPNKKITVSNLKTVLGGTTGAQPFEVHDVTDELTTLADEDRFVVSDQSASGDPNKYITFSNLHTLFEFDLHDDVASNVSVIQGDDRFVVSDESTSDDPNRYITATQVRPFFLIDIHEDFESSDRLNVNSGRDRFIFSSEGAGETGNPNKYIFYDNLKLNISNIANETRSAISMADEDVMLFGDVSENTQNFMGTNTKITVGNLKNIFGGSTGTFDLHEDVDTEKASPENSDRFVISDEEAEGDPNKYLTFENLRSAVLTNLGNRFLVSAVADEETTIDNDDFMVFSDESAQGDPNKKITVRNLKTVFAPTTTGSTTGTEDFDLHDDVGTQKTTLDTEDRFLISDEEATGDPNKYVIFSDLKNAVGGLLPREIDDFLTFVPREIDFLTGYRKGLYSNVEARELTKSLDVSARTEFLMKGNAIEGIIFGGFDGGYKSDAYVYKVSDTGVTITALTKAGNASTLTLTSMGAVGSDRSGIIFGGNNGGNRINTMHEYSLNEAGNTFTLDSITRASGSATPPSISSMGMAGDLRSGIIFGGNLGQGRNNQILEYRITGDATKEVTYRTLPTIGLTNASSILSVSAPAVVGDATSGIIIGGFGGASGTWSNRVIRYDVEPIPNQPQAQQTNRLRLTELTKSGDTLPAMDGGHVVGDATSGIIFGGRNDSGRLASFYHYEVEGSKVTINELTLNGSITKRAYGRMVGDEESGVIFAGTDTSRINEFNFYETSATIDVRKLTMPHLREALTIERVLLTDNSLTDSDLLIFSDQGDEIKPDKKISIENFKTSIGVLNNEQKDALDSIIPDSNDFFEVIQKTLGDTMDLSDVTVTANNFTNRVGFAMVGSINEAILFGGSQGTTYDDNLYSVIGDEDNYYVNRLTKSGSTLNGRRWHDMAGDLNSGIIFGGHTASRQYSDFYAYNLTGGSAIHITALTNVGTISGRYGHRMLGDIESGVIFGGYDGTNPLNDFHFYTTNEQTRQITITELTKAGDPINAVIFPGMVGNKNTGIIFGGRTHVAPTQNRQSNNFYKFVVDGNNINITQLTVKGDSISIRDRMYMAGDDVSGLIFGGFNGTNFLTDLYDYEVTGDTIILRSLSKSGTSGITAHGFIAGDTANGIIFGGDSSTANPTTHVITYVRSNDLFRLRTTTIELSAAVFGQLLLFGIIDSVPDSQTTIADEDVLVFADESENFDDKKISFGDLKTSIGSTTGAPPFMVHDVSDPLSTPAGLDRFVLSDESEADNPNKYITYTDLRNSILTDIGNRFEVNDVPNTETTVEDDDLFVFADESISPVTNKKITFENLKTAIGSIEFEVNDVSEELTTLADDDRFVVADESAADNPNKYITFENLKTIVAPSTTTGGSTTGTFNFSSVTERSVTPIAGDRFMIANARSNNQNAYIQYDDLRTAILTNIGNRFLVSAVTDTETTIADDEFFVVSQGAAVNADNKKVTFENIKTLIRNAIETEFTVHDVSDALSAPANDDRFVLSDESATGDPNKYITFSNLRSSVYRTPTEVSNLTKTLPNILDYFVSYRAEIGVHPTMSFARRTRDAVTSRQGADMAGDARRGVIFGGYDGTTVYRTLYTYEVSDDGRDVQFINNHTFDSNLGGGIYPIVIGGYEEGYVLFGADIVGSSISSTSRNVRRYVRDNEGALTITDVTYRLSFIPVGAAHAGDVRSGVIHGGIQNIGSSNRQFNALRDFFGYSTTATAFNMQPYPNTQVTPQSKRDRRISGHTIVGDGSKGAIFGGSSRIDQTNSTLYNDFFLYEFRGNNYHVKELTKTGDTISARQLHMMAGDATQGIIFGGVTDLAADTRSDEFFVYRVNEAETEVNFTKVGTLPSTIVARDSMAFTGNALDGVMFGGDTGSGVSVDFIRWHEDVTRSTQRTTYEDLRKSLSIDGSPETATSIDSQDFLIHSDESSADKPNVKIRFDDLVRSIEERAGVNLANEPATFYGSRTSDNLSSAFIEVFEKVYSGTVTSTRLLEADTDEARREFASAGDHISGVIFGGRRGTTYLNSWQKYEVQDDGTVVLTDLTVSGTNFPVAADPIFIGDKNLGVVAGGWNGRSVVTTRRGYHVNYDTNTVTLSTPTISGTVKTDLAGMSSSHAIADADNPTYRWTAIHGGFDPNGFHNQFYVLQTRPQQNDPTRVTLMSNAPTNTRSPTQAYGSMALGGANLFMFGGRESGVDNYSNKMYWRSIDADGSGSGWVELDDSGSVPSAREGACITVDQAGRRGNNQTSSKEGRGYQGLIIGGLSTSGATTTYHNDVWLWYVSSVDNDGNPSNVSYRQITGSTMGGRGLADCIGNDLGAIMFFGATGHNAESREIWRLDMSYEVIPKRFNLLDLKRMLE